MVTFLCFWYISIFNIFYNYSGDQFLFFWEHSRLDYRIGKLYDQQGNNAKAKKHYQKAAELWKNADPGVPEVEDVRKRLAKLELGLR